MALRLAAGSYLCIREIVIGFACLTDYSPLTVRSSNGLKRANIHTFGKLKEILEVENGLLNIWNIGQKSIKEIKQLFFEECYVRLLSYEKGQYLQEILEDNLII